MIKKRLAAKRIFSLLLASAVVCTSQDMTAFARTSEAEAKTSQTTEAAKEVPAPSWGEDSATGDIISFGSYPQTEVTGDDLTDEIKNAEYDAQGDATVAGVKYRREKGIVHVTVEEYEQYKSANPSNDTEEEILTSLEKEKTEREGTYHYYKWEPIEWKVLKNEKENGTLFVMSKLELDAVEYYNHTLGIGEVRWRDSRLRQWANVDKTGFYHTAFDASERNALKISADNPEGDLIYLLSAEEAQNEEYGFESENASMSEIYTSRMLHPTDYAYSKGMQLPQGANWYLRSPGQWNKVTTVLSNGYISDSMERHRAPYYMNPEKGCLRHIPGFVPVMRVDTNYGLRLSLAEGLEGYKSSESYTDAQQKKKDKAVKRGVAAINAATGKDAIQKACDDAKAEIDKIETADSITVGTEDEGSTEAEPDGADKSVLKSLNFDLPKDAAYDQENMNEGTTGVNTMSELVVTKAGAPGNENRTYIYNNDQGSDARRLGSPSASGIEGASVGAYTITEAVDADGDGKKELLVQLYLGSTKSGGAIKMTVSDLRTKKCLFTDQETGGYIATANQIPAYSVEGLLSMCAGDFDGDGCEEIAVYTPNNQNEDEYENRNTLKIKVYKLGTEPSALPVAQQQIDIAVNGRGEKDCQDWLHSYCAGKKQYYSLPFMSLEAGDIDSDGVDDLLTVASFSTTFQGCSKDKTYTWNQLLNPNTCFGSVLDVYMGQKQTTAPLEQVVKKRVLIGDDTTNDNDFNKGCGVLRNASVTIANVTGADTNEIVFGGNYTGVQHDDTVTGNTTVTRNRYVWIDGSDDPKTLIGFVSAKGLLTDDSKAAALSYTWTIQENAYDILHYYNASAKNYDPGNEPVTLDGFAAYGSDQPDTIAMQGQLFTFSDDRLKCNSYVPPSDVGKDKSNVWISAQAVGNVTNDAFGRETLYFISCQKISGKEQYYNDIVSVWGTVSQNGSRGYTGHLVSDTKKQTQAKHYTMAMCDIDDDSSYIRYEKGNTDIYYSNVQLLSVLQAAPVYEELGEDYVSGAETSYAKSSGESSGSGHTHEISAGAIVGFEHETSFLGLVNLFTMEVTAQLAVTAGWEFEKTAEKEFTTTYNTGGTEDVAVLYTVPYVRYNAQIYIPEYTLPTREEYDAKKAFYDELIANIQEYKDSGAGVIGEKFSNPKDGFNNDYTTNVSKNNYDYQLQVLQIYAQWLKETQSQMEGFEGSEGLEWGAKVEGGWEDYFFCVPQTPLITSVTTDTYDRIAGSNEEMESLYGSALPKDYVAGCPDTYVRDQADLKQRTSVVDKSLEEGKTNAGEKEELGDGFISSTSISASSSSPSQTIAFTEENSKSTSVGGELSLEVTTTVGEVKGGVAVSTNHAATWSSSTTKGCEFSGTVPNLPKLPEGMTEKEYSNYDYKWKLISYEAMVNGSKVPVVGYYTKYDNRTVIPPSAPIDAQIQDVTSNSITLTWNGGRREADHYNVYQVTGNGSNRKYEKLQEVAASGQTDGVYSFTHSDLEQDVEYTYVVAAFNADESVRSIYSDALTARTLVPEFNVKLHMSGIDSDETYLAGTELELTAALETGNYPQSQISQYFWQVNDGNGWKKLPESDTESYNLRALAGMNGYQYRCNAYVAVDNRIYLLSSGEAVLNVRKAEVQLAISADKQEGAADSSSEFGLAESDADVLELTAFVTSDDLKEISGQIVFYITNDASRAAANEYSAELSSDGVAQKKCRIQKEGHYTIRASYVENEMVGNADSGNTLPYFAYNASQKEDREAGRQMEQEIYGKEWDDINLKNVLSLKDEITGLNEKYSSFDKKEFMETAAKNRLKNAVDLLESAEVLEAVDSLNSLTAADAAGRSEEIQKAREAYNQLSDTQKELLKEENVEAKLKAAEDMAAVSDVVGKINTVGDVTAENLTQKGQLIEEALKAYGELTDEQKALMPEEVRSALERAEVVYRTASAGISPQPNPQASPETSPQPTAATSPKPDTEKKQIADISNKLGVNAKTAKKIKNYADKYGIDMDTVLLTDEDIMGIKTDEDAKGSQYRKLQAQTAKVTDSQVKLTWKKMKEASGYRIYQAECGKKNGYTLIKKFKKKNKKNYTVKELQAGKGYRFIVCAYKVIGGKEITVSAAKTVHTVTDGGKKGNVTEVNVSETELTLKKSKKYKLETSVAQTMKKGVKCRAVCYESDNTKVAAVSKKGKITAKGKGECIIYVYAHNGLCAQVTVTVK